MRHAIDRRRMIAAALFAGALLCATTACAEEGIERHEAEAVAMTERLLGTLSGELERAMREEGPEGAVAVCRDIAPAIKRRMSLESGARITRVGTRVRNPLLGMPDDWERAGLDAFEERRAGGEAFETMTRSEVVERSDGRHFRFMRAIGTQPLCLTCHGSREEVPEPVRTTLAELYPRDEAIGYRPGALRGAVSITRPLPEQAE